MHNWADNSTATYVIILYRAMLCIRGTSHDPVSVRPYVCLSVTSRSSTKTAKRRITQIIPHDSPGNLVFWCQRSPRNSTGVTPYEGAECKECVKIGDFRQVIGYISKTVQDRRMVSIKAELEVVCALSNADIADYLECPLTAPNYPIFAFCTAIHSVVTGEPRDFIWYIDLP